LRNPNQFSEQRDEQTRRTGRVLDIIQFIAAAPGHWTRKLLAEHYEISERMIQKDLEIIRVRLGLALLHDECGYSFERLPHLPMTVYSFPEALALLTAARLAQAFPGVNSGELAAAIARLESIFPDELRPWLRQASEQLPRQAVRAHRQDMLALLQRALVERKQVEILYATASRRGEIQARTIEPYHLLPYGRSWQLIAYDHKRQAVREFKLDRIQSASLLDSAYTIPPTFDIDAYLGDGWGLMRGSARPTEEVSLLFEPEAGRWVTEEDWHKSQQTEDLPDGRVRVTFQVGVTPEMVSWLMHYGEQVRVEKPDWLRDEVREKHRKAAEV
jgi:predicted DNA-binding transcriptional regulator YafY